MERYGWDKIICVCLLGILSFCRGRLWADLDMHVYNVGQANCILVTVDNENGFGNKSAIFFDTAVQKGKEAAFNGNSIDEIPSSPVNQHIKNIINNTDNHITEAWLVLSHTDDDHTNAFYFIAKICQLRKNSSSREDPVSINDVIVGTVTPTEQYVPNIVAQITAQNPQMLLSLLSRDKCYKYEQRTYGSRWVHDVQNSGIQFIVAAINRVSSHNFLIEFLLPLHAAKLSKGQSVPCIVGTDANDASLVAKLTYDGKSILLSGDAPGKLFDSIVKNEANSIN